MTDGGGFAAFIGGMRPDPDEGVTLEQALRGRGSSSWYEREPEPRDSDVQAANLLARGYVPGSASQLAQRYGDTLAELETERDKVEASQRRQERIRRDHDLGKITVFDIMRMQDADEGDPHRVEVLEQRAASLRQQLEEVQQIVSPRPAPVDPYLEMSRTANRALAELARPPAAPARPMSRRSGSLPKAPDGCVCGEPGCTEYPDSEYGEPAQREGGQDCGCAACDVYHADSGRAAGARR
jgi:hypothetical protein